jgi:hypothetical protein
MSDYPEALRPVDHLRLAHDFYQAFCDLPVRTPPQSWPRYFMLCHGMELALKAYPLYYGATPKELLAKNVRHSLTELLTRATNKGLSLGTSAENDIRLLDEAHEEYWHRYPMEEAKPVYTIDQFQPVARKLLDAVTGAVYGTSDPPISVRP